MSILFLTILVVAVCNGKTIVNTTSSDSSGDYYIAGSDKNFDDSEIQCSSEIACYIECGTEKCFNLTVHCGNSSICDIECGADSCVDLAVYISPDYTKIHCADYGACDETITLYTNYTYYPSSTIFINCHLLSCEGIAIKDALTGEDNYDQLTIERFKIICIGCSWKSDGVSNPVTTPTIVNETGEYYSNMGSLVDIECTTDKLCYIDCNARSCSHSKIDCGPSKECYILCGYGNGCGYNYITAMGQDQFTYLCDPVKTAIFCEDQDFNLTNIDSVNITCEPLNGCGGMSFMLISLHLTFFTNFVSMNLSLNFTLFTNFINMCL